MLRLPVGEGETACAPAISRPPRLDQPQQVPELNEKGRDLAGMAEQEAYAAMMLAQDAWVAWRSDAGAIARELNERALAPTQIRPPDAMEEQLDRLAAAAAIDEDRCRREVNDAVALARRLHLI
jgi:hypothetical protein